MASLAPCGPALFRACLPSRLSPAPLSSALALLRVPFTPQARLSCLHARRQEQDLGKFRGGCPWHSIVTARMNAHGNEAGTGAVRSVPVQVARELLNAGYHYLDVRTPEEFDAGHPKGAVNVPFMFKSGGGMTRNAKFVEEVLAHFNKDDEIVVGCQSGKRSLMAATELQALEFTGVTDMVGGYGAWVQGGLQVSRSA